MKKFREYTEAMKVSNDEKYMQMAIVEAKLALQKGNLPVGAVLATSSVVFKDCNTVNEDLDVTAHAVINLVRKSGVFKKQLDEAILYTTVEPCIMCAKAAELAGIREVVFGCYDKVNGFISNKTLTEQVDLSYRGGVLAKECLVLFSKEDREGLE
jgi:tRNA(adenine34) deaminase